MRQPFAVSERFGAVEDDFAGCFEELYRIAYRAAYSVLGDRAESEDCAQEASARALVRWRKVHEYAPAWVARVSVNLALDRVRATQRANRFRRTADTTSDRFELAARRRDLATALAALPKRQREAIVLRYLVDLPEADTAGAMGCTVGTVKSTVARGLDKLRLELGPQWAWDD
jgi:RNA polymerase sigma factor (sigma-70 family)